MSNKGNEYNTGTEIKHSLIGIVFMLVLLFFIKSCITYKQESYIEGVNNSPNKYVQTLHFYKTYYNIVEDINNRPYKVLNIIAKEGTWRFKKNKSFHFNDKNEWFIINEKFLCPTETLTKDCLWAL